MRLRNRISALFFIALALALSLSLIQTPASATPTVVGLWHMDETSGTTAVDATGNGHDGVDTNIVFVVPGFDGTGGAYSFDGTSRVFIPDSPALNPEAQDITLTAHVMTSTLPGSVGDYDLIRKSKVQTYKMEIADTGTGFCKFKGTNGGSSVKGGPNVVDGLWHTIVCTKTSTQISLTVDGITVATKTVTVGSISPPIDLFLGRKPDGTDAYTGLMDEVSITIG